jgi:ribosomal protein S1
MKDIEWEKIRIEYPIGSIVVGPVEHHANFGVFVNLGIENIKGLIEVVDFLDSGIMTKFLYPALGQQVKAVVIGYSTHNNQIRLSMKPSSFANLLS